MKALVRLRRLWLDAHLWLGAALFMLGRPLTATTALAAAVAGWWIVVFGQFIVLQRRLAKTVPPGPRTYDVALWLKTALPIFLLGGKWFEGGEDPRPRFRDRDHHSASKVPDLPPLLCTSRISATRRLPEPSAMYTALAGSCSSVESDGLVSTR